MKSTTPGGVFDSSGIKEEISRLEAQTLAPEFWEDRDNAEKTMQHLKQLKMRYAPWMELLKELENVGVLFELALEANDESMESEVQTSLDAVSAAAENLRALELLGEEMDAASAFVTIHSGAGGTESCDWVSMLYRMYGRWVERHGFKMSILDMQEAEGGIKSIDLQIDGEFVHGFLKGEGGIHRLVRISPFDSNARRHTTFASVYVSPVFDDEIAIEIRPEDIRVDTYRASGAGGQHVNKTSSAVRMTHLETGIVVQCQNERSQLKNRVIAMKVLKSRLYEYYRQKQEKERAVDAAEKKDIGWGSQIRSYVFQPYTMVKDLRTRHETGNIQAVMDGDIDPFIYSFLRWRAGLD